jgi:acetyl-CoA acyltransferase
MQRRVFLCGGAVSQFIGKGNPAFIDKKHPDFGKKTNPTYDQWLKSTTEQAFQNVGVKDPKVIDSVTVGNFAGELFVNQGHMGAAAVGCHPALLHKPSMRVEAACASGALAVRSALMNILAGEDVSLAAGVEVQTTVSPRQGGDYLARASDYARQRGIDDFTFPALFAKRMKGIAAKGHFTMEDTARIATKAYANGNKNPLAHMTKTKMPFETASTPSDKNPTFLGNAEYKEFLRISDCSQVSDGAAVAILASEEGLKKLGRSISDCVEIIGIGNSTGSLFEDPADPTRMDVSAVAAQRAFAMAGMRPTDIEVAEVHDCFTIAEMLMYEALGIAQYGEAAKFAREGTTTLEGKYPVNTGGGLLSFGHPVGATGVKQVLEIYRQMKGQCGDYQLKKVPALGATLNMGGDDRTSVSMVMKNL